MGVGGAFCTQKEPVQARGTYTVTLAVTGPGGVATETQPSYINVYEGVAANFSALPTEGIGPPEVAFTDLSTGDYDAHLWEFGDGLTATLPSLTHTYVLTGTYTVTLTVSGLGGSDTEVKQEYIMDCLEGSIGATHLRKVDSAFQALSTGGPAHPGRC